MIDAGENIRRQQFRRTIGGSFTARHGLESIGRSAACLTIMDTSSAREDCRYRIGEPVEKGFIPKGVHIADHFFHDVTIVYGNVVEIVRNVRERVAASFPGPVPPGEIGNMRKVAPVSEDTEELTERLLC